MKTIGIIAPNYGRKEIFTLWCAGIKRLRETTGLYIPATVVSEAEDKAICKQYDIEHITQQNKPVSEKFNRAVLSLKGKCNAVMVLGSDDIISTQTFHRIAFEVDREYDLVGVNAIYFFATDGVNKGKMVKLHSPNRMMGVAKTISARVLDEIDWMPWNVEKNWGLDAICQNNIKAHVETSKVIEDAEVFDLKDRLYSMNKASFWFGKLGKELQHPARLWSILGDEEIKILTKILK